MEQEYEELQEHISKANKSFSYFIEHIFPCSFKKGGITRAPHTFKWANRIQFNRKTATLSARKHLKSTTIYAFIMWRIFKLKSGEAERWLYMSYNQKMSIYHTENIKNLIQANPYFDSITDLTPSRSYLEYTWGRTDKFLCSPSGILTFNRGWHGLGVICDDILQDPTSEINFTIIDKINRIFKEQVMSLPIEGGELHLVGTAQHNTDLFFWIKGREGWDWAEYKAILNEAKKKTLWPELFSYKRLKEIRELEIGEKAFNKEYMCSPVWTEEAYFQRDQIVPLALNEGNLRDPAKTDKEIVRAGYDIGKKTHPSHFAVFSFKHMQRPEQIFQLFMDGWDYTKQVNLITQLIEFYKIDALYYDDTRGELEPFVEQNLIDRRIWKPVVFKHRNKFEMASNFSKFVDSKTENTRIILINHQRMIDSILSVNNDLEAPESDIGHGDAFWSIALALMEKPAYKPHIAV